MKITNDRMKEHIKRMTGMTAEEICEAEYFKLTPEHDIDVKPSLRIETAEEIEERRERLFGLNRELSKLPHGNNGGGFPYHNTPIYIELIPNSVLKIYERIRSYLKK